MASNRSNPRVGSYGYTWRLNAGVDLNLATDITLFVSASGGGQSFSFNLSASTGFVGASTVYSTSEGLTFNSAQWFYAKQQTADAFLSAQKYNAHLVVEATGENFITPVVSQIVDA